MKSTFTRDRALFVIERGIRIDLVPDFIRYHVQRIIFRELLQQGTALKTDQATPWNLDIMFWYIYISTGYLNNLNDVAVTIFHEIIHIMLDSIGVRQGRADEREVERVSTILAAKHPEILETIARLTTPQISWTEFACNPRPLGEEKVFQVLPYAKLT